MERRAGKQKSHCLSAGSKVHGPGVARAGGKTSTTAADGKAVGISSGHQGSKERRKDRKRERGKRSSASEQAEQRKSSPALRAS